MRGKCCKRVPWFQKKAPDLLIFEEHGLEEMPLRKGTISGCCQSGEIGIHVALRGLCLQRLVGSSPTFGVQKQAARTRKWGKEAAKT